MQISINRYLLSIVYNSVVLSIQICICIMVKFCKCSTKVEVLSSAHREKADNLFVLLQSLKQYPMCYGKQNESILTRYLALQLLTVKTTYG